MPVRTPCWTKCRQRFRVVTTPTPNLFARIPKRHLRLLHTCPEPQLRGEQVSAVTQVRLGRKQKHHPLRRGGRTLGNPVPAPPGLLTKRLHHPQAERGQGAVSPR